MKSEKLSILYFEKDQLVNLNREDLSHVKGGLSTFLCIADPVMGTSVASFIVRKMSRARCYYGGSPSPNDDYVISTNQYSEVTCATIPPIVIRG